MPRTTTKKSARTAPTKKPPTPAKKSSTPLPGAFIDASLMERAIKLRTDGLTMEAIGTELGVKATGYLAKKIKATYGADALAAPAKPSTTKEA
jgi:hypothetical protein